jgi:hypothetical protein
MTSQPQDTGHDLRSSVDHSHRNKLGAAKNQITIRRSALQDFAVKMPSTAG